jgi:hypothetical protein
MAASSRQLGNVKVIVPVGLVLARGVADGAFILWLWG